MYQIRIHGRGGQGVVTAAEMLSVAAFTEGHWAQAFPSFGSERTGAPVVAFARIDEKEIRLREPIQEPDVVLVQDRTLLESEDVFGGIRPDGYVLINSSSTPEELGLGELIARLPKGHVQTVPAEKNVYAVYDEPHTHNEDIRGNEHTQHQECCQYAYGLHRAAFPKCFHYLALLSLMEVPIATQSVGASGM